MAMIAHLQLVFCKSTICSAALAMLAIPGTAAARNADGIITYKVKRGDTLIALAHRYFKRPGLYRVVQRQNRITSPRQIPVGKTLRISRSFLKYKPSTARFISVRGKVFVDGKRVKSGDVIREGVRMNTAAASYATLQLGNGSRVSLPSNSAVKVQLLRRYVLGGNFDYDFAVTKGGARSKVSPLKSRNDRYRVRSPKAVSAVRGTDFNVRFDADTNKDFAEVLEGRLAVKSGRVPAAADTRALPSGKGLAVAADGKGVIDTLLPPPELIAGGKAQTKAAVTFAAKPQPGERGYRFTISADAGFTDIVFDEITEQSSLTINSLNDGSYFLRVRAIAASGLQGMPATLTFRRRLNDVKLKAGQQNDGFVFSWDGSGNGVQRYHFQLIKDRPDAVPMVDQPGLVVSRMSVSDLPPGTYFWRVGTQQFLNGETAKDWSDFEKLSLTD